MKWENEKIIDIREGSLKIPAILPQYAVSYHSMTFEPSQTFALHWVFASGHV